MHIERSFVAAVFWLLVAAVPASAQFPVITAGEVVRWSSRNAVVIDSRLPEEYQAGHIPGAISIPAERMKIEASRLPKDKSRPMIFYCRGAG